MKNFLYVLTVIFVTARIVGLIKWSWWLVFSPLITYVLIVIIPLAILIWNVYR